MTFMDSIFMHHAISLVKLVAFLLTSNTSIE